MDDPYLDSRSSRRVWEERPKGPFEVNEPLPKPVQLWKSSINKATNKPQELLHFKWQRNAAQRVLESLELHSYEWTVKAIKTRECLDKLDRRDIALSTFAMSRNKNLVLIAMDLRALDVARDEDNTAELRLEAARNARVAQTARIDELVADGNSPVEEPDRAALLSICSMDPTELQIYLKMMEVYDRARSHFLFEIVDPQVKRFLNAERLKAEALNPPLILPYQHYRELLLERTQNSELTQDLLTYILKPREEGCPVYLWVAERISESNLLTGNGLNMSNQAWLAYTIAFITMDERLVLQVPSLQERSTFDNGRGYELADLEAAISAVDVTTLKPFRQSNCQDPVAAQVLMIAKLQKGSASSSSTAAPSPKNERSRYPPRKEHYASNLPPKPRGKSSQPRRETRPPTSQDSLSKLEAITALPHKDGRIDMDAYGKYKEGGLRRKIHDAIRAKKCIRCFQEGHLRSSCQIPPRSWEEDFNKGKDSFWKPKQARPQWLVSPSQAQGNYLVSTLYGKSIVLDTASDVSIGRTSFLKNLRLAKNMAMVEGIGGNEFFDLEGDLQLDENNFLTLFAVSDALLPPGAWALIGNPHLKELCVSLDHAQANPGSSLLSSIAASSLSSRYSGSVPLARTLRSPMEVMAWILFLFLSAVVLTAGSTFVEISTFFKFAFSLCLSLLVWMIPQWVPLAPSPQARPPVGEGATAQAQTSPTDSRADPRLCPRSPHRPPRSVMLSSGPSARFGALLLEHAQTRSRPRFRSFCLPAPGILPSWSQDPRSRRNRAPHPRRLQARTRSGYPRFSRKSYHSPRAGDIRRDPPPESPAEPEVSLIEAEYARRALISKARRRVDSHNLTPRNELGGMSPCEVVFAEPVPHHPMRIYRDRSYPPNCTRVERSVWEEAPPRAEQHDGLRSQVQSVSRGVSSRHCFMMVKSTTKSNQKLPNAAKPLLENSSSSSAAQIPPAPDYEAWRQRDFDGVTDPDEILEIQRGHRLERSLERMARQNSPDPIPPWSSLALVPRAQWMIEAGPDLSEEDADAIWTAAARSRLGPLNRSASPPTPSSFTGGNTLKVTAEIVHPDKARRTVVNIAIDTQSDVTTALREYLTDVHEIVPDLVSGLGGGSHFSEEGTLHVWSRSKKQKISMPALVAPQHQLPLECVALLGVPAILKLEVAVERHLRMPQFSVLQCHLGEKRLREWLEHHPDAAPDTRPFDIEAISINPLLSPERIVRVKQVIRDHAHVFEGHENSLPKPFHTEPITLKFKPNATPQSIPMPRWTVAQAKIVTRWAEDGLRNGSLELSTSAWSSRLHLVLKAPPNVTAELADLKDCKLRPCGDYRLVNTQIDKMAPNLPTGLHQLEKAAGHKIYFEADSVACYNSFRLALGLSREALAIWTPIGLVQPTVLPFGQKNSGTEAQGPYLNAAKKLKKISNYVDDWLGYSNDFEELLQNFKEFLQVCLEYNITLNAGKTRFGFPSAQFFGFIADENGTRLADKHLCPLKNMVPPEDIAELRRTLGLFVVSRKYIKNYAMITKPLTDLLRGKQPTFVWEAKHQEAYEFVRDALLAGIHLAAPNFELPFHLQTDASEDGKGAILYQLPTCAIADQYPYCKKLHAPDLMAIIAHFSKAFTEAQRLRPPFYLEADSLLWATDKSKFYALSSRFPLYTYSDHMPLQWMKKSEKGPVSQFLVEQLSEIETVHQYIQGELNTIADAASRYPLLGPKRLAPRGLANSVQEALDRLPARLRSAKDIQVHAGTYTADLKLIVQGWIATNKGSVLTVAPTHKAQPVPTDLAILVPRPEDSPVTLALYLVSSIPFVILVPNDLLAESFAARIFPDADTTRLKAAFDAAGKIQILSTQMTWIVGNIPEYNRLEMFAQSLRTPAPITGRKITPANNSDTFDSPVPTTLEEWIREQKRDPLYENAAAALPGTAFRHGLYLYAPDNAPPRILVPPQTRESLIRFTHEQMFHLGEAKVVERLSRSYWWPTLRKDTRRILQDCPDCEIEKARRNEAHGLFRARPHDAPRSRFAMDFQGQGLALTGENEALGIIDTTTRYVTIIPMKGREASTFMPLFLDRIVFRHGPPAILHSDEAPEFMSNLVKELLQVTETILTTTLAHNARSNGCIEVFWRFWNRCMRLLTDEQYAVWPTFAARIEFAYNTAPHSSLGGTAPYQLYYGAPPRDVFSAILDNTSNFTLVQTPDEEGDLVNVQLFASAVKTSTAAFIQLAKSHDQFVKQETADLLNSNGHPRTFVIGDLVKARFPPTQAELATTGRRSSHVSSWRGPCRIIERLSSTSYSLMQLDTKRVYERMIGNLLPWKAISVRKNKKARFDPVTSAPFVVGEIVAVRDAPASWIFVAKVEAVAETAIIVQYFGTKSHDLAKAKFLPSWHRPKSDSITLSLTKPNGMRRYTGVVDLNAMPALLVARQLSFTSLHTLTSMARRQLMPVRDELFTYM